MRVSWREHGESTCTCIICRGFDIITNSAYRKVRNFGSTRWSKYKFQNLRKIWICRWESTSRDSAYICIVWRSSILYWNSVLFKIRKSGALPKSESNFRSVGKIVVYRRKHRDSACTCIICWSLSIQSNSVLLRVRNSGTLRKNEWKSGNMRRIWGIYNKTCGRFIYVHIHKNRMSFLMSIHRIPCGTEFRAGRPKLIAFWIVRKRVCASRLGKTFAKSLDDRTSSKRKQRRNALLQRIVSYIIIIYIHVYNMYNYTPS